MELGARIEAWLKAKGRSRPELATYCEVTASAVCLWCGKGNKHVPPSNKNRAKMIEFLGLTEAEFWGPVPKAPKKSAKSKSKTKAAA